MSKISRVLIVLAVLIAVAVVLVAKQGRKPSDAGPAPRVGDARGSTAATGDVSGEMPRLLDLGSVTCTPCKMMAPILDELEREYAGRMEVSFVDVKEHPEIGRILGVSIIPTQVFFDASGLELFRHEGFYSKDDILAKWQELGVDLGRSDGAGNRGKLDAEGQGT